MAVGVLRVRTGGAWVDLTTAGPQGPVGPQGPAGQTRLVGVGSVTSPTITTSTWGNVTNPLNIVTAVGHYYRITLLIRAIFSPVTTHVQARLSTNAGVSMGDSYHTVTANVFSHVNWWWLFLGDGASHAFIGALNNPSNTLTVYGDGESTFICEDLGVISP